MTVFRSSWPALLDAIALIRISQGSVGLPSWPAWCYIPVSAVEGLLDTGLGGGAPRQPGASDDSVLEGAILTALASWRPTQGIYRFDPDVFEELWDTPVEGALPSGVLECLPEWCVYVETPGRSAFDLPLAGFFAHLDADTLTGGRSLRIVFDSVGALLPVSIAMGRSIGAEMDRMRSGAAADRVRSMDGRSVDALSRGLQSALEPAVSLLLYLCSEAAEFSDRKGRRDAPGGFAAPARTPNAPTVWETAVRLGARLRLARQGASESTGASHQSPRPHVRRAHWHHFWTGRRDTDRKLVLRWMHPVLVSGQHGDIAATIRSVE